MKMQWIPIVLLIISLGCGGTDDTSTDTGQPNVDTTQPVPDTIQPTPDTATPEPDTSQPTPDVLACVADCAGKLCGPDGCGSTCGTCPDNGSFCDENGQCVQPSPPPPPPADGSCTGDADTAIIDSKDVEDIAKTCGISNLGNAEAAATCIKDQTGLSDPCVLCFQGTVTCGIQCAAECLFAPDSPACDQCLEDKGCLAEFATCSGIDPNE